MPTHVPWMIENGAKHTVQTARNVAHAAFGGHEGIVGTKDFEIRELAIPGTSIRAFPGTAAIKNRAADARDEMYVWSTGIEEEIPVPANGTAATVYYMVVLRVENPNASGETWPAPADPATGPYIGFALVPCAATDTRVEDLGLTEDHSMLPLARLAIPATTSTIEQAMLTDLRQMGTTRTKRDTMAYSLVSGESHTLTQGTFTKFPNVSGADLPVDVPEWATHAQARAIIGGLKFGAGDLGGYARIHLDLATSSVTSSTTPHNESSAQSDRTMILAAGQNMAIPEADRGKPAVVEVQAYKSGGTASLLADWGTMVTIEIDFYMKPESNL